MLSNLLQTSFPAVHALGMQQRYRAFANLFKPPQAFSSILKPSQASLSPVGLPQILEHKRVS